MEQATNNPPSDAGTSEDEEAAMAAAMGFSGFGKAPAAKKRRYNPNTDAFIDGQELRGVDKGGRKGQGSGGNEVPLGRVRGLGASGTEDRQDGQREPMAVPMAVGEGDGEREGGVEERGVDTSRPPTAEEKGLDTSRLPPAEEKVQNDARAAGRRGGGRGQRNELWYVDYYDPSFNENPWRQLEKEHGLPPVGTWIDRSLGNQPRRSA